MTELSHSIHSLKYSSSGLYASGWIVFYIFIISHLWVFRFLKGVDGILYLRLFRRAETIRPHNALGI